MPFVFFYLFFFPDKRISEGLFCPSLFFGVFIGIIGGTPDKRISEGLFCLFFVISLLLFGVFIGIIWGGGP